jgi:hypothetical protein
LPKVANFSHILPLFATVTDTLPIPVRWGYFPFFWFLVSKSIAPAEKSRRRTVVTHFGGEVNHHPKVPDRLDNIPGRTWWLGEAFELREDLAQPADVLVTHSGPEWIGPSCRNELVRACADAEAVFGCDTLIAELQAERRAHEKLFRLVKPKTWYLGHFHERAEKPYQGCRTRILDCNELLLYQTF